MKKHLNTDKGIVKYDEQRLKENAALGMRGVDPADIRPPSILLAQKSSDFSMMIDRNGNVAQIGQYFHTGKLQVFCAFEGYILYAAKSKYLDKRNLGKGKQDQYKILGVMADDFSLFAMTFKSSSLYCLTSLFGIAASNQRPLYSYRIRMETKELSGEKGTWTVPVCRIVAPEKDTEKLLMLEDQARAFDKKVPVEENEEELTDKA